MPINSLETIQDFLAQKRIAVAGVSRNPKDYSRMLFSELVRRGYDVLPVNPNADEIDGRHCFASLFEIHPAPDAALILTPPSLAEALVHDCARAGITRIWMRQMFLPALKTALDSKLSVTAGECPFMYLENTQWYHRLHGYFHTLA